MIIYHIAQKDDLETYSKDGCYTPPSVNKEGFTHCSTREQVLATANRRFAGVTDLFLLVIDTEKVSARIVFEDLRGTGEKHPHIYGPLPLSAVQAVHNLIPNKDGVFTQFPAT